LILAALASACTSSSSPEPKPLQSETQTSSRTSEPEEIDVDDDDDDDDDDDVTSNSAVDAAALRKSYEGCKDDGKVWRAAPDDGPPDCGDKIAKWCCSKAEVMRRFAVISSSLDKKFSEYAALHLYQCSEENGRVMLHFAKITSMIAYQHVFIENYDPAATQGPDEGSCDKVTIDDLLKDAVLSDTGTDTATADEAAADDDEEATDDEVADDGT
jgi:hypothetical protein